MNSSPVHEFFSSMDFEEKLSFVASNGNAASFAYKRLHMHRAAAHLQMTRIGQAAAASKAAALPDPGPNATHEQRMAYVRNGAQRMEPVFAEVHFYFVCWSGCRNMLQIIVGQPEFLPAKKIFDGYRKEFEHYVAGRNSFEHFHERLPGQSEEHRVKEIQPDPGAGPRRILWGFSGGKYVHSNLEWDITQASVDRLERYVGEILEAVQVSVEQELERRGMSA